MPTDTALKISRKDHFFIDRINTFGESLRTWAFAPKARVQGKWLLFARERRGESPTYSKCHSRYRERYWVLVASWRTRLSIYACPYPAYLLEWSLQWARASLVLSKVLWSQFSPNLLIVAWLHRLFLSPTLDSLLLVGRIDSQLWMPFTILWMPFTKNFQKIMDRLALRAKVVENSRIE